MVFEENDPFFSVHNISCQNFIRAQNVLAKDCSLGAANKVQRKLNGIRSWIKEIFHFQVNLRGSYLDMHFAYACSAAELAPLRSSFGGQFRLDNRSILVDWDNSYHAGDNRVGQTPWLALLHSLFFRVHNWFAQNMAKIHPKMDDEELFQKSRRINIATYQHLVYDEWIPQLLGLVSDLRVL